MLITIRNWIIENSSEYMKYMKSCKTWEYEIKEYKRTRSSDQNRYYWSLLWIVADEIWTDANDVHEKMRMKFLYVNESGKQLAYCKSTSKLTTKEFSDYIENIRLFMADFNIILPNANEFDSNFNAKNELDDIW